MIGPGPLTCFQSIDTANTLWWLIWRKPCVYAPVKKHAMQETAPWLYHEIGGGVVIMCCGKRNEIEMSMGVCCVQSAERKIWLLLGVQFISVFLVSMRRDLRICKFWPTWGDIKSKGFYELPLLVWRMDWQKKGERHDWLCQLKSSQCVVVKKQIPGI